ncbi:DEAD/DEAH box helicase [Bacillus sp. 1P02SD]|uniref:DEAD/DEAH box helicase n=1 Tax=Bacillus sp. 1P02SD TaxID=3132264 RepID=UPI0039A26701
MYNKYTQELIDNIPELEEFNSVACRRVLTKAYVFITQFKLGIQTKDNITDELLETKNILRKLADTMESIAVFDRINGLEVPEEVEIACSFVAAEALSLLNTLVTLEKVSDSEDNEKDFFVNYINYTAFEASFLYMISGFDINAKAMIDSLENISIVSMENEELDYIKSSKLLYYTLKKFINGYLALDEFIPINISKITFTEKYSELNEKIRANFYLLLTTALNKYISWLKGDNQEDLTNSLHILNKVRNASSVEINRDNLFYSDIYHFSSLLIAAIQKTQQRSLVNTVPYPTSENTDYRNEFHNYLKSRAKGTVDKPGRPFLWQSALNYVKQCLPGPNKDCVITMPTGSGKSFIAELAIAQALSRGWVLYLAPTNALVHQIRRDLKAVLSGFEDVNIRSFVGGEEYTTLGEEVVEFQEKFIAVMTPEKCSLALRLYPEQFQDCSLCIFDECHLINDSGRGANADILLTRLIDLAEEIKFLLMSAMISNGDDLSNWLKKVHDNGAVCESIKWRPTRTLRTIAGLNRQDILDKIGGVQQQANKLTGRRKNLYFDCSLLSISGLSGPWTLDGEADYKINQLPITFQVKVTKGDPTPHFESWKNTVSRKISEEFTRHGLPSINFILTSKHHAFSSAGKVETTIADAPSNIDNLPELVKSYLMISDKELGLSTVLWGHLTDGIAVHSSAMLQVEQAASEYMFLNGHAKLMFATGTLAQGLNLPAVAVIVAGTSLGDPRDTDNIYGLASDREKTTILNAFGRAGRPGFGNQGIAILVPDNPPVISVDNKRPFMVNGAQIMSESDASVEVHSPIERFLDNLIDDDFDWEYSSKEELTLTSLLVELDIENNIDDTLGNTFGAFNKSNVLTKEKLKIARDRILKVKEDFIAGPDVPDWLNLATMKAGTDLFRCKAMWEAYNSIGLIQPKVSTNKGILDWLSVLIKVMSHMHPRFISFLPSDDIKTETVLTKMRDYISGKRVLEKEEFESTLEWASLWGELEELLRFYMTGKSYKQISEKLLGVEVNNNGRSSGSNPIPTIFKFIKEVVESIAMDAGCFLAINELGVFADDDSGELPEALKGLPLAIRNGCDSLNTLSWFRFGYRQRICSHYLNEVFPVPDEAKDDKERANWVRSKRRQLLSTPTEDPMLDCIRHILLQES